MSRVVGLACILLMFLHASAEAGKADPAVVDSLLAVASDTMLAHKARMKIVREAIGCDRSGRSRYALARLHMSEWKKTSPEEAQRWLLRAIQREPENADYRATYAELFWMWDHRGRSYEQAMRALELDPDNVRALYWAGRNAMWHMTRFLEAEWAGTPFSLKELGEEKRDIAIHYLTRALAVNPEHWPSRKILGLVYYEASMPGELVALFEAYVERQPENPNGHFFVGLGYQALGHPDRAYSAYVNGLARMSEPERQFMQSIFLMVDKEDVGTLPDEEAIRRFWRGRDPFFLTPVNERLMEHCQRVAYANLRYGDSVKGIEGWTTEKGQAYIRYGHPLSRVAHPAEIDMGNDLPSAERNRLAERVMQGERSLGKFTPRKEIWTYDGFRLVFENTDTRDAWKFGIAWVGAYPLYEFSDLTAWIPEFYKDPYWWERYDAPYQIAQFRADEGKTRVEVYYALQGEQVRHQEAGPGLQEVDVQQGLFLFDAAWNTVRKEVGRVRRMPWVVYDEDGEGYLFAGEQLMLDPGAYHLGVEVEDQATKAVGTFRDSLRVRRFGYDSLEASSLLLARRIVERQDRPFGREQFMILPDPLMQCAQGGQVSCYFEVYNLAQDAFGATHYRVAYQMRVLVEGRTGEVEPEWTTVVSHTLRGSRAWEPIRVTLDMEDSAPGLRALRVVVDDLADLEQAVATTTFRVMW